jgi:alpha/beta superfamily hydrolase
MRTFAHAEGLTVEAVRFPSRPYWLEGELAYPEDEVPAGAAVVAGPHPLLGGDMGNNVVRGLTEGLAARGVVALRFNYRGVGRSEGPAVDAAAHRARLWATSHVDDERDFGFDLAAARNFLCSVAPESPTAVMGYSFGCSLPPHASGPAEPLVLVAPTVGVHDYNAYDGLINPLLVIASENDFAAAADRLRGWFNRLRAPKRLLQPRLDDHFFRGHEDWLAETTFAFLQEHWR